MTSTAIIRAALAYKLGQCGLLDRVVQFPSSDLELAMEALRDSPDALAVIVPSKDTIEHAMAADGVLLPARAEWRMVFEILITCRDAAHADDGDAICADVKDGVISLLCWDDLSLTGLICLPTEAEAYSLDTDERRGREAWKISLEIRQIIEPES